MKKQKKIEWLKGDIAIDFEYLQDLLPSSSSLLLGPFL